MCLVDKVRVLIADQVGCALEEVKSESRLQGDLGADSLDVVELVMDVEEKFSIEISDAEAEKVITVDDLIRLIEKMRKK